MKIYSACPKKLNARMETIIEPFRDLFGSPLPANKQYWTMCASHTDESGDILPGCELDQMLSESLITPDQFHGVDIDEDIITANAAGIPEAHWHHGDFHRTMIQAKNDGDFHPGIVNCDHLRMPQSGGAEYVARLLAFLSDQLDVLFVANLILSPPRNNASCEPQEYLDLLSSYHQFQYAMTRGWHHEDRIYVYGGTGQESRTVLGTMVFWK